MSRVECIHPSCHCSFASQDSMLQHYTDRHDSQALHNQTNLPCPLCNRSSPSKGGLAEHLHVFHRLDKVSALAAAEAAESDHVSLVTPLQDQQVIEGTVACNDCGRVFRSTDFLHQHQWDSADHTRVSKSPVPNHGTCVRACSQCGEKFRSADHLEEHFMEQHPISEVPESSEECTWQIVAERFRSAWKKPTMKLYKVHRIFKVYNTGRRRKDFQEYSKELKKDLPNHKFVTEAELKLRNKVRKDGNERLRYHGTTVKCGLGRSTSAHMQTMASLCTSVDCNLCRILQVGFKKSKCRQDRFQRFGKGIYSSSISSKASAYVKCSSTDVKIMMECKVLVGRPHHSTRNAEQLEGPPLGFHSVQGDPGVVLNYDELVVYDDRAILPAFIILYSSSDCQPSACARFLQFARLFALFLSFILFSIYFIFYLFMSKRFGIRIYY